MDYFHRKLYALLHAAQSDALNQFDFSEIIQELKCLKPPISEPEGCCSDTSRQSQINRTNQLQRVASSSDRVNLHAKTTNSIQACHPISGQKHPITQGNRALPKIPREIYDELCPEKVFWWFWRFYPELFAQQEPDALLLPAHPILPDCPLHSYQATVSALVGATCLPENPSEAVHPYLLLFSFSPVQEFIKASRKFLDFWAGSYLLHYLSAHLCWHIAQIYGPDAVIVPSLWSQEIIDALLFQKYPSFEAYFKELPDRKNPVERFDDRTSTSLSTAGFPNVITALVPGKVAAEKLGKDLADALKKEWIEIGEKVKEDIKSRVIDRLANGQLLDLWNEISQDFLSPPSKHSNPQRELEKYQQGGCWEWNTLWDEQLKNTWEPYWTAIPLGFPDRLECSKQAGSFDKQWIDNQQTISQPPADLELPAELEHSFDTLNVGTWWGSIQQRLRITLQAVKNTRVWQIPAAPGERSTISGQFSAVHPFLNYDKFPEGGGLPEGSMRLFWMVMSKAYPGLFNGSEHLNALELTKRMAWQYGGVADRLRLPKDFVTEPLPDEVAAALYSPTEAERSTAITTVDYERLIRFPNITSIAAARFAYEHSDTMRQYWSVLARLIRSSFPKQRRSFGSRTRCRAFNILKTDNQLNPDCQKGQNYNGVMFSSKWLAEDMNLNQEDTKTLRGLVEQAHKEVGFGDGSPADWWAIVLADGDGMGQYVSGQRLLNYSEYLEESAIADSSVDLSKLKTTKKRMGPATHVGFNRALLDFSNRLVPSLTEHRFCGKVIYSGGDDVMAVLPLEDLPEYLLSLRAAWKGDQDPAGEFSTSPAGDSNTTGYWHPKDKALGLPMRPHFTMGENATMSMGIVIAHSSVPLPTVLESLWTAEKDRAKNMPGKDGLCFRVIYSSGNQLEALMKGHLLEDWWNCIKDYPKYGDNLSPLLYRLAEELPRRACVTKGDHLFSKAAEVIMNRRDETKQLDNFEAIRHWLNDWEDWAYQAQQHTDSQDSPLGTEPDDLGRLLRFTAFWVDKRVQRWNWVRR